MAENANTMSADASQYQMSEGVTTPSKKIVIDWKRVFFILLGLALFFTFYLMNDLPDAVDPAGKHFALPAQGRMAIGLFLMAAVWWIFEVMPIGATAIGIGLFQVIFSIRTSDQALKDFFDPSVWFIFGSVVMGLGFAHSGLTKRMAYKMLGIVGENTNFILLGTFLIVAGMTLLMAHTAVAAAMFPLLLAINSLYSDSDEPTRFGKGLFVGMAWTAGAGSVITFLGSARAVAGAGMFKKFTGGQEIGFFELTWYMLPLGLLMVFFIWLIVIFCFKPEKPRIDGLRERVTGLAKELGPMNGKEKFVLIMVAVVLGLFMMKSFSPIPFFKNMDRAAIMMVPTVVFFLFQNPRRGRDGRHPLEHHSSLRRGHEYRLLSLRHQGRRMAGRELGDLVPACALAGLRPGHRLSGPVSDQLHHERGGHRHHASDFTRHRAISACGAPRHLLCISGHSGHAV